MMSAKAGLQEGGGGGGGGGLAEGLRAPLRDLWVWGKGLRAPLIKGVYVYRGSRFQTRAWGL